MQYKDRSLAPIGVFDSGAGGLTILSALRQELPHEQYIYFGDTRHCPYGTRSDAEIIELTQHACHFLVERGVKLIVIACNTASQAALSSLRSVYSLPFVGVVPAVKPAARITKHGRIGVAATSRAAQASYLRHLIDEFAAGIEVYAVGCPSLVTLVERGELEGPAVEAELREVLHPLFAENIDVLVLGCTHFPALRASIERVAGKGVQVIDSSKAIARRTRSILETEGQVHPQEPSVAVHERLQVFCSGDPEAFSPIASKILGYPVEAHHAAHF